jgi:predicted nucleic acid-binding protein
VLTNGSEAEAAVYLDSSGIVKLVLAERESVALDAYLRGWSRRVSSAIARTEVIRAARTRGAEVVAQAREVLDHFLLIEVTDDVLDLAAELDPLSLRSLDAIHVATALHLGSDVARLVTYDDRMASAARAHSLVVDAPGR